MRTVNMCINVKINIRHMILHDIPMSLLQRDKNVQDFLWRNIQHMVLSGKPSINKYTKWFSSVNGLIWPTEANTVPKDVIPSGELTCPTWGKNHLER